MRTINLQSLVRMALATATVGVACHASIGPLGCSSAFAQGSSVAANAKLPLTGTLNIKDQQTRLEMIINSSQILSLDRDIARANVQNDALVDMQPISRNQMLISSKATGFTQVDLYGPNNEVYNVQVTVLGDARELEAILHAEFPSSNLQVRPIQNAVILSGQVTADAHVAQAVQIAEQYYPTVINKVEVLGVHTVMLHVQIMEVSRTKLRNLGIDYALGFGDDFVQQTASGLIQPGAIAADQILNAGNETYKVGVINNGNRFFGFVNLLKQDNLVKVLADPTLVAIDGRPASFNSGGEFPILVPAGLGQVGVEFREFGTKLDFVAKVRGDGRIHLEVRPMISEVDESRSVQVNGISVPGLRSRYVETAVELNAGQTLALAGLLQVKTETTKRGIPGLSDLPYLGALFRNTRDVQNEIELLITVTPDFAAGMDPSEVPAGGPGYATVSPSDKELYLRGYLETPNLCNPESVNGSQSPMQPGNPTYYPDDSYPVQQYVPAEANQPQYQINSQPMAQAPGGGRSGPSVVPAQSLMQTNSLNANYFPLDPGQTRTANGQGPMTR